MTEFTTIKTPEDKESGRPRRGVSLCIDIGGQAITGSQDGEAPLIGAVEHTSDKVSDYRLSDGSIDPLLGDALRDCGYDDDEIENMFHDPGYLPMLESIINGYDDWSEVVRDSYSDRKASAGKPSEAVESKVHIRMGREGTGPAEAEPTDDITDFIEKIRAGAPFSVAGEYRRLVQDDKGRYVVIDKDGRQTAKMTAGRLTQFFTSKIEEDPTRFKII